jgi:plasmid maintenance system killer protein
VIKSFRHKGLAKLYEAGSTAKVQANHANRLRMQLAALDTAQSIEGRPRFSSVPAQRQSERALRLSKALGRSPESWLAMQDHYDLW